ncbi:L-2-hydroxyglutarate oxidase [Agrococcus casei]|uniref:L-2-hydroxyglutarate oxidase n=1 Tax=Agrococcus casei TaxID=343512 RepID=UPI003F8DB0DD
MSRTLIVAGAGIVGLSTAYSLAKAGNRVIVLDKEEHVAAHQTGNNSGVIHSGLYYTPGSLKAKLSVDGASSIRDFAVEHGVKVDICGKLVVATDDKQLPQLNELLRRGKENGVPARLVSPEEAREYEPHVSTVGALHVESTGIIDYKGVCEALARLIRELGGEIRFGAEVKGVKADALGVTVETRNGSVRGHYFVNCGGLHSDRIARLAGLKPSVRIIPFRGEYYELIPEEQHLVRGLIYPVPDPQFPFLGVHLTKMIDGSVHAGPNAIFAFAREGYKWLNINPRDMLESAAWPGLWKLGAKFWKVGLAETYRSFSRKTALEGLRELVPALGDKAIVPTHNGVRAQAMNRDGSMVDDFLFERGQRQIHVLNAPSPAATASLEIGNRVAAELLDMAK